MDEKVKTHDYEAFLSEHGVHPTANRLIVARVLARAMRPLSLAEIEGQIGTLDKSTISRALSLFREHHLVHVIDDGGGSTRYELCRSHHHDVDDDAHPHFHCESCGRTFCLDHAPIPPFPMPDGYEVHSANFLVSGICPECREKRDGMAWQQCRLQ